MRIISGSHKGRRINIPKKLKIRPTTDRAKEALFNILENRYFFKDKTVLIDSYSDNLTAHLFSPFFIVLKR